MMFSTVQLLLSILCLISYGPVVTLAELRLLQGPLQNISYISVPTSLHLGPQHNVTISGRLLYLPQIDPCDAAAVAGTLVSGQLVLIPLGACSPETQYDFWSAHGVTALLTHGPYRPGGMFCYLTDSVAEYNQIPYVQLTDDADLLQYLESATGSGGANVILEPDPNPWVDLYGSSAYQVLARWIPAALQAICSLLSWTYLHRSLIQPRTVRPAGGRQQYRFRTLDIGLFLRGTVSGVLAIVRAFGGYYSTSNLSGPVQRFFFQETWGITAITALIVSSLWNTARQQISPSQSLLVRLLSGEFHSVTIFMFTFLLILDLTASLSYATYMFNVLLKFLAIFGIINVLTLLLVALQFLMSASQFRSLANSNPNNSISEYVQRMSRLVTCLGVLIFFMVLVFSMIGSYPDMWNPKHFFVIMTSASILHAASCITITLLLKPGERDSRKPVIISKPPIYPGWNNTTHL